MRTTLTISDDVAVRLRRMQAERHGRFRDIVNEAMRLGLNQMTNPVRPPSSRRTSAVALGRCLIGGIDDVAEALAASEGETFR
jgi:hypothetical protein